MSLELDLTPEQIREEFYQLRTLADLAVLLDVPKRVLGYYAYKPFPKGHYKEFSIPKKGGGFRKILAPSSPIKIVQRKLNQVFSAVYFHKAPVHGFIDERSIVTNAARHLRGGRRGRRYVFNADIKDFFPSVNRPRVRGLLRAEPL